MCIIMSRLQFVGSKVLLILGKALLIVAAAVGLAGVVGPSLVNRHDTVLLAAAIVVYALAFVVAAFGCWWIADDLRSLLRKGNHPFGVIPFKNPKDKS